MYTALVGSTDFHSDARGMFDLYLLHRAKLEAGLLSIHPQRWIKSKLTYMAFDSKILGFENDYAPKYVLGGRFIETAMALQTEAKKCNAREKAGFYFGNVHAAKDFAEHVPLGPEIEGGIQDEMWERTEGMELEVSTEFGRIDCLTKDDLIEIKDMKGWKHGLGQLLIYGKTYPKHRKILHLYSFKNRGDHLQRVQAACQPFCVTVRYQQLQEDNAWRRDRRLKFFPMTS